jgi:hypothetical protein
LFATGVVDTGGNFAACIIETGGKFATGVIDTSGATLTCKYLREFSTKFEKSPNEILWGWGGN